MSIYFSAFYCPKLVIILFTSLCTIKMKAYYIFTQIFVYILIKIDPTPYSIYNDIFFCSSSSKKRRYTVCISKRFTNNCLFKLIVLLYE